MKTPEGGAATRRKKPAKKGRSNMRSVAAATNSAPVMGGRHMRLAEVQDEAVAYSPIPNIEGLNQQIVALLQEDGRASFSSIAQKLGVAEATVRARVSRMREANLIHFITVVNPIALGYSAWAMLGINVAQGASADDVARYFRDRQEVVYAMRVAARFDILAEIVCETPDDLRDFLDKHCYGSKQIASVEPMVGLGLYKSLFKWDQPVIAGNGRKQDGKARGDARKEGS